MTTPDSPLVGRWHPSPNHGERRDAMMPSILLLHYTGVTTATAAIDWLSRPESQVSCHYVVDEDGEIVQMVAEARRAWHAGVSSWGGIDDVNSSSIGIEIQNGGHAAGAPAYSGSQMLAVAALGRDIVARHAIAPHRVLAHSDVAPGRKIDPGEWFDWAWLAGHGVGFWLEPHRIDTADLLAFAPSRPGFSEVVEAPVAAAQAALAAIGYRIAPTGRHDDWSRTVVAAFQRHWRPRRIDGDLDHSTLVTIERLAAEIAGRTPSV